MPRDYQLTKVHRRLLEQAAREHLIVPEALPRHMRQPLQELVEWHLVWCAPLYGERDYYYLSDEARALCAEYPVPRLPLTEPRKIRDYAIQDFCRRTRAQRLTTRDFQIIFPQHAPEAPAENYDRLAPRRQRAQRIGFLRVDCGGRGRWDRVIGRLSRDVLRHCASAALGPLIEAGAFEVALITATLEKARRIGRQLHERPLPAPVAVRLHVVADLVELIASPPNP